MLLLLTAFLAVPPADQAGRQSRDEIRGGGRDALQFQGLGAQEATPAHILDRAIALLREHHINSAAVNWDDITAEANRRLAGPPGKRTTYGAIQDVIDALGERHTALRSPLSSGRPRGAPPRALELPTAELIGNGWAMVRLPGLVAPQEREAQYEGALKQALLALDARRVCGWILDLRGNSGGSLWPMLRGLDPLLGAAPFGSFRSRENKLTHWSRTSAGIRPAASPQGSTVSWSLAHAAAPIAVLLGPRTASSGEMVAIALIGRSGVRTFGEATAGLGTANRTFPLPDGSRLSITTSRVRDRTGKEYSGPIIPDEQTTADDALDAAQRWLAAQPCDTGVSSPH